MLPYDVKNAWETALDRLDYHIEDVATRPIMINSSTIVQFEDGTIMDGGTLLDYLKALQRIITKDYPEELL